MRYEIYTLYDKVAKESNYPYFAKNRDVAIRSAQDSFRNMPTLLSDHELVFLGTYDTESCKLDAFKKPERFGIPLRNKRDVIPAVVLDAEQAEDFQRQDFSERN